MTTTKKQKKKPSYSWFYPLMSFFLFFSFCIDSFANDFINKSEDISFGFNGHFIFPQQMPAGLGIMTMFS